MASHEKNKFTHFLHLNLVSLGMSIIIIIMIRIKKPSLSFAAVALWWIAVVSVYSEKTLDDAERKLGPGVAE